LLWFFVNQRKHIAVALKESNGDLLVSNMDLATSDYVCFSYINQDYGFSTLPLIMESPTCIYIIMPKTENVTGHSIKNIQTNLQVRFINSKCKYYIMTYEGQSTFSKLEVLPTFIDYTHNNKEIILCVRNHSDSATQIQRGDKIARLVFFPALPIVLFDNGKSSTLISPLNYSSSGVAADLPPSLPQQSLPIVAKKSTTNVRKPRTKKIKKILPLQSPPYMRHRPALLERKPPLLTLLQQTLWSL
jgi:hypothetical protein